MKKYLFFFALSLSLFLVHAIYTRHALYGDGNGYYVTSLSLLTEGTFKADPVINYLQNFPGRDYVFSRVFWDPAHNPYSVGTSLAWLPALALTSVFSGNPFDLWHELAPGLTGIILMLAGLYFLEQYLRHFFSAKSVSATTLALFFGSNVFYYTALEPALSHQLAFFLIAFLLSWTYNFRYSPLRLVALGILFGLLHITRISDTLLLLPIFLLLKWDVPKLWLLGLGIIVGVAPQMAAQAYYYESVTRNFYVTESSNQWSFRLVHLFEYLFSYQKGLFIWSPLYLLGVSGLLKMKKYLILATILALWLLGSFWSAHSSMTAGFGQRLAFAAVPYFGIGIAYLYDRLTPAERHLMTGLFVGWNTFLLYGFYILKWKNLS